MREIFADSRMMHIGKNGEGDALRVVFPVVTEWEALYGAGGAWTLNVQRNGDALAYAAQDFTIEDGTAVWVVTDADAAVVGEGRCELTYKIGGTVAKSRTYAFRVDRSLTGGGDVPDPVKGWQEALEERVDGKLDRPDGGSAGDVLTKTEDGEEWKPVEATAEQVQADWNQNDRTAKDYIKNRPFYSQDETMVSSSYVDVLDSELNEMIEIPDNMSLIANMRWYKPFPFLEGSGKSMLFHIIIHISGQSSDIHNRASMSLKKNWSVIGGDNWKWDLGNSGSRNENFLLFFITDLSALDSAYTGMFTKTGIFLQRNNNWGYTYTKYTLNIGVTWLNMLDTKYIGSAIERTGNKVSEIVSGADAEQYPSVAAVEKYVGDNAVKTTAQSLNDMLKEQARRNIDAVGKDSFTVVSSFDDIYSCGATSGVCLDSGLTAPDGMQYPVMFYFSKTYYNRRAVTMFDGGGKIWTGLASRDLLQNMAVVNYGTSLGLTSAQVGQIIKVKAVDDKGRPTEWEALNRDWEVKATYALKDMTFPAAISIPPESDSMLLISGTDITIDAETKVEITLKTATNENGYSRKWEFSQNMYKHGWGCGMFMELNLLDKATKKFGMQRAGWERYMHYFTATTDIPLGEANRNFYIINVDNADNINPETTTNVILYTRDAL